MSEIVCENLIKVYGREKTQITALNKINFRIKEGEFVIVLGASGSGKSTLLNILGGMDEPTSGHVYINNNDITTLKEKDLVNYRRNDIGFVFQFYNLMPNLTAYENVLLSQKSGGMSASEALELVGLQQRIDNFPAELSGGEQQRVAIARAIVKEPSLLLCDEPTGALDSKTGKRIIKLLQEINLKKKKTIIVVTHNESLAPVASRIIRLADGNIIADFKQDPQLIEEIY